MSKYEKKNSKPTEIENIIVEGEEILWSGKPKKGAFVFNKSMFMFPIALIWMLFDGFFIAMLIMSGDVGPGWWFISFWETETEFQISIIHVLLSKQYTYCIEGHYCEGHCHF